VKEATLVRLRYQERFLILFDKETPTDAKLRILKEEHFRQV
jgi:hypothetical protein